MTINKKEQQNYINETFTNVQSNLIKITDDKLRNILTTWMGKVEKSHDWMGWLGVEVSLSLTLCTSDFRSLWVFDKSFFMALFVLCDVGGGFMLLKTSYSAYKLRKDRTIDKVIKDIEGQQSEG